jgi:hypothetical protein
LRAIIASRQSIASASCALQVSWPISPPAFSVLRASNKPRNSLAWGDRTGIALNGAGGGYVIADAVALEADDAAAPIRPERHILNSIATMRRRLIIALARSIARCPRCARTLKRTRPPY